MGHAVIKKNLFSFLVNSFLGFVVSSEAVCFWKIMYYVEYFYDNRKSSCKCCWYYSCTTVVKNLYVTVNEPLCRNRNCCWERQLCSKVVFHIVLCLAVWNRDMWKHCRTLSCNVCFKADTAIYSGNMDHFLLKQK